MVDKRLQAWIKQQRSKGFSDSALRKSLIDRGYDPKEVKQILVFNQNKGSKKIKIIISLVLLLLLCVGLFYFVFLPNYRIINASEESYKDMESLIESSKDQLRYQLMEEFILDLHNLSKLDKLFSTPYRVGVPSLGDQLVREDLLQRHSGEIMPVDITIFYDCLIETMSCKTKRVFTLDELRNSVVQIAAERLDPDQLVVIELFRKNDSLIVHFPSSYSDEELLSVFSAFRSLEFHDLRELEIANEIDQETKSIIRTSFEREIPKKPDGYFETISDFKSGKTLSIIKEVTLSIAKMSVDFDIVRPKIWIAQDEWNQISLNYQNRTSFLSGSENIQEYESWLIDSIDKLYQDYKSYPLPKYSFGWGEFLFNQASYTYFLNKTEKGNRLVNDMKEEITLLKSESVPSEVKKLRKSLDINESRESRVIRLRILQYLLADQIIKNKCSSFSEEDKQECGLEIAKETYFLDLCDTPECFSFFAVLANDIDLCYDLRNDFLRDFCRLDYIYATGDTSDCFMYSSYSCEYGSYWYARNKESCDAIIARRSEVCPTT